MTNTKPTAEVSIDSEAQITDIIRDWRTAFIDLDCGCRTTEVLSYLTGAMLASYELGLDTHTTALKGRVVEALIKETAPTNHQMYNDGLEQAIDIITNIT